MSMRKEEKNEGKKKNQHCESAEKKKKGRSVVVSMNVFMSDWSVLDSSLYTHIHTHGYFLHIN